MRFFNYAYIQPPVFPTSVHLAFQLHQLDQLLSVYPGYDMAGLFQLTKGHIISVGEVTSLPEMAKTSQTSHVVAQTSYVS